MNCKKCGRPMGKKGYCSNCDAASVKAADQKKAESRQKLKKLLPIILGALALVAVIIGAVLIFGDSGKESTPVSVEGKQLVEIEIRDYGTIRVALDADAAPISVANFLSLAESGFYNGLKFHRIIEGFMMQGGDNGIPGSVEPIKGEFSSNGVDNPLKHTRGAISMARTNVKDSATSQFFIVHQDSPHLDGDYACFGYVTEGMEVVDAICEYSTSVVIDGNGTVPEEYQPIIEEVRVIH